MNPKRAAPDIWWTVYARDMEDGMSPEAAAWDADMALEQLAQEKGEDNAAQQRD